MRFPGLFLSLLMLVFGGAAGASATPFERLSSQADLVLLGQVIQVGEADDGGGALTTIAIDRQLQGLERAGALTFWNPDAADAWQVGDRSAFFLARRSTSGARFVSVAGRVASLEAGVGVVPSAAVVPASVPESEPNPISVPGVLAGLAAAAGILAVARRRRLRELREQEPTRTPKRDEAETEPSSDPASPFTGQPSSGRPAKDSPPRVAARG
ncbi:hypothetical protein [Vulgatibacter incomptus]|uniref:Uncharacterized protein n=1 Tax=Vulgatibacter incomptus TaxID=1391653 RepID=A0A0K1PCG4_9BACT|nr:hypothetical protein [Vulgatibacter incomptus]AKU91116.1 hypothetical protein AKJ08_1503 [Vulgatibacter incomptus]